jgi:hypothetical protein
VRNGFAFLHRISWDPYNQAEDLIPQAKKYKQENGCYPERICADRIYINTKNRNFCTRNNIQLSGKRLGRPPRDPELNAANKQLLSADQRRRNEVEGCFGSGKRKYSLRFDNTSAGQRWRDFDLRLAKMDTQLREAQEELEHSFLKACASDQLAQAQLEQLQRAQSLMVRLTPDVHPDDP